MKAFNPYQVDEIVAEANAESGFFGLIGRDEADRSELYGYEVTMSGGLVVPEFHPRFIAITTKDASSAPTLEGAVKP